MKRTMVWLAALILSLSAAAYAQDISGNWQGTLQAGQGLRTVLKITKSDAGLKAVMYSIDQGGSPIPVTTITMQGTTVNFSIKPLDVTYTGTLNPDGKSIAGNATQNGQTHALNLELVSAENMWAIPEPPKPMAADAKPKFDVLTVKPSSLAFLRLSTLSTAQRLGQSRASCLHLLDCRPPMKCHRISWGRSLDFSRSSCT